MESTIAANFPKTAQALAERGADKAQAGIRSAQESVRDAGNTLAGRAQTKAQQGFDAISDVTDQARNMAASTADAVVGYTKKNPVQALAIAAAAGALLYGAMKALRSYRE